MARGRMIASTVADDKRLQSEARCGMMVSSEQVLETHLVANVSGVFCCLQLHTCSAQGALFIDHAATVNARVAIWVSSLDEQRTLRVQKQETCSMARINGTEGGYVYIARSGNMWKIGCTREKTGYVHSLPSKGDLAGVHSRLRSLRKQTGVPFKLAHVMYVPKNLMQFEHELHTALDAFRCSSLELFSLPDGAIDTIKGITAYAGTAVSHLEII